MGSKARFATYIIAELHNMPLTLSDKYNIHNDIRWVPSFSSWIAGAQ